MENIEFENKYGITQKEEGWFTFEYSMWWRMASNKAMCFAGVYMTSPTPVCGFECSGADCLLLGP